MSASYTNTNGKCHGVRSTKTNTSTALPNPPQKMMKDIIKTIRDKTNGIKLKGILFVRSSFEGGIKFNEH